MVRRTLDGYKERLINGCNMVFNYVYKCLQQRLQRISCDRAMVRRTLDGYKERLINRRNMVSNNV